MFESPIGAANALPDYFDRPRTALIAEVAAPAMLLHLSSRAT